MGVERIGVSVRQGVGSRRPEEEVCVFTVSSPNCISPYLSSVIDLGGN